MSTAIPLDIKDQVRERYGVIAEQGAGCCQPAGAQGSSCCSAPDAIADIQFVEYGDLREQVVAGSDLGLGCGTPTRFATLQPGQTVLDLGSGAGIDVFLAARSVGPTGRVLGVDMTPEMIARARENARNGGFENVEFRLGDIEALPVADASVDVVLSNCVINLAPDKARVYREIHRVLRPGGHFSISDMVTIGEVPEALRQDVALWTGCIAGALDRDEYLDLIGAAGFQDVQVTEAAVYDSPWAGQFGIASVTLVGTK